MAKLGADTIAWKIQLPEYYNDGQNKLTRDIEQSAKQWPYIQQSNPLRIN